MSTERNRKMVVSFDLGQKGLAYCEADVGGSVPEILTLELMPNLGKVNNAECVAKAMVRFANDTVPAARIYVLESQPAINRRTCMMEAALSTALRMARPEARIIHLSPKIVQTDFGLPHGYAQKKRAATKVATKLLHNPKRALVRDRRVFDSMGGSDRKHDMADALLMALWAHSVIRKSKSHRKA